MTLAGILAGTALLLAAALPAAAKGVSGRYGYLGEWSVEASLEETTRTWYGAREWSGPARVRHVGLCVAEGNPDSWGMMSVRISALGGSITRLKVGTTECEFTGSLQTGEEAFATCNGTAQVPMSLRER